MIVISLRRIAYRCRIVSIRLTVTVIGVASLLRHVAVVSTMLIVLISAPLVGVVLIRTVVPKTDYFLGLRKCETQKISLRWNIIVRTLVMLLGWHR